MTAPVVVALPGMLCDEQLWSRPGFDLGPDARLVPAPLSGSTIDELVRGVLALPYPDMSLMGLSLGGIVAMSVAAVAPERVSRVITLSASARPPRPDQHRSWDHMSTLTDTGEFTSITPELLMPSLVRAGNAADPVLRETIVAMATAVGPKRFRKQLSAQRSRVDVRPMLGDITCPVLACAGAHDVLVPVEAVQEIVDGVPNGRLEVIPHAGHLCSLEQPADVSRRIRTWLADPEGVTSER